MRAIRSTGRGGASKPKGKSRPAKVRSAGSIANPKAEALALMKRVRALASQAWAGDIVAKDALVLLAQQSKDVWRVVQARIAALGVPKGRRKAKREPRIGNVLGRGQLTRASARIVSGGLPSLGKRR